MGMKLNYCFILSIICTNCYAVEPRFIGKEISPMLHHLEARHYSNSLGRFITQDKKKQFYANYNYGNGAVILYSDPTGLMIPLEGIGESVSAEVHYSREPDNREHITPVSGREVHHNQVYRHVHVVDNQTIISAAYDSKENLFGSYFGDKEMKIIGDSSESEDNESKYEYNPRDDKSPITEDKIYRLSVSDRQDILKEVGSDGFVPIGDHKDTLVDETRLLLDSAEVAEKQHGTHLNRYVGGLVIFIVVTPMVLWALGFL